MEPRNHGENLLTLMEHFLDESIWPHTSHCTAHAFEPQLTLRHSYANYSGCNKFSLCKSEKDLVLITYTADRQQAY